MSSESAISSSSTHSSQYSAETRKGHGNPLTELIETEKTYMNTLKIIDSLIAPIWMKQMTSAAPDFSELLKYVHDILKANKRFCLKLTKIASNPQMISDLGDALMQWVDDLEVPYANYSRSYIPNINYRTDILRNPSIGSLLQNLSANVPYNISLESLFDAPIQQLKYYKELYSRLLENTDSGRADHKLLLNANKRIDIIMVLAKNSAPNRAVAQRADSNFPPLRTGHSSDNDLATFERQVDCSKTADLYGGTQINYQLRVSNLGARFVMRNSFVILPVDNNGPSIRAHLLLSTEVLVICRELYPSQYDLIYPAIPIGDITVKSESLDREFAGEYLIRLSVLGKKHIIIRAESREIRNTWIGVDQDASSLKTATPRTLSAVAQKKMLHDGIGSNKYAAIDLKKNTISSGATVLESSDEQLHNPIFKQQKKSRDTIMDIYDEHFYDLDEDSNFSSPPLIHHKSANISPQSVKIHPHVPNVPQVQQRLNGGSIPTAAPNKAMSNVKSGLPPIPPNKQQTSVDQPVKELSHVQMTYIQPPTAKMSITPSSPPIPAYNESLNNVPSSFASFSLPKNTLPPSPDRSIGAGMKSNMSDSKPSSPRAIELQRAVIPEVMQAVTQKTDEYISNSKMQLPRTSSMRGPTSPVHKTQGSSPRLQSQPQYQQRPPQQMMQNHSAQLRTPMQQGQHPMMNQQHHQNGQSRQMPQQQRLPQQHSQNRTMQSPSQHYQQQQQSRPGPPAQSMAYNNQRPIPSPSHSPNLSSDTRRPPGAQPLSQGLQQPHGRFVSPSPSLSNLQVQNSAEDLSSPPHSPNPYNPENDIRQVLYSSSQCDVFHWHNQTWYATEGQCLLHVRVTHSNRFCVAVELQNTGELYLNAWIMPTTVIRTPTPTDVSISVYMGTKKENYLIHFEHPNNANVFSKILQDAQSQASQPQPIMSQEDYESEEREFEPVDIVNVPQTLNPVMQCKAKLFIKNETSNWSTFGSVTMRISQQAPSMRMLIQIENDKAKLVSAIVKSGNVEKISSKRISFLLVDDVQKTSIVYMIHLREDQTGNKIYEYLRTKNAEHGW